MKAKVVLSANAGVMLEYAGVKILSDILHHDYVPVFSSVPEEICTRIAEKGEFSGAELFLISHEHPDHFNKQLAAAYMKNNKAAVAAAPIRFTERQIVFSGVRGKFNTFNTKVEYLKTPHEKQRVYADANHYSYVVSIGEARFVFFNDMEIQPEYIDELLKGKPADAAFINFPWITLKHARRHLAERLEAKNMVIYHLPIPEEDDSGFNNAVKKSLSSLSLPGCEIFTLSTPLDSIEMEV